MEELNNATVTDAVISDDLAELEKTVYAELGTDETTLDAEAEKKAEMLGNCILAVSNNANVGIYLTEERFVEGQSTKKTTVFERVSATCMPKVQFANENTRLTLSFEDKNDMDLKQYKYMWEEYWRRNTEAFLNAKANAEIHYHYEIQCSGILDGKTYIMYFVNPVFGYAGENSLVFTMAQKDVFFTSDDIDYKEVDREIDYEFRTGEYADNGTF